MSDEGAGRSGSVLGSWAAVAVPGSAAAGCTRATRRRRSRTNRVVVRARPSRRSRWGRCRSRWDAQPAPETLMTPRGRRDGRRAPAGDHRRRHERGARRDHDRRSTTSARRTTCSTRRPGPTLTRRLPRRRRSRPLPRHRARQRRSRGRLEQRVLGRGMDDAGVVRGPLRRAARRRSTRTRPPRTGLQLTGGFDARAAPDRRALHGRRQRRLRGRELRGAGRDRPTAGLTAASPTDAFTLPLLVDAAGNVYAATRSYADGREALVLTFAQSPTRVSHARARVRRRELGDARAVRRRAPRLRVAADRRLLPAPARSTRRGHLPHHRRRPAGVRQLAERRAAPIR